MSKERELLKRVRDTLRGLEETHYDLYWDIQAELEKIEQKPNNVGYLYKQEDCYGDIQTVFKVDKPYIRWHNVTDVTPVYLAPPKREPAQTAREMYQRGYAKAKDDLKREQDVVIQKLAEHLERVLFAWGMGRPLSEENDLYMDAHYYLKGLKDDAND